MDNPEQVVRRLLKVAGMTFVAGAGIRMNDKPMPLLQLLVLCMLATAMRAALQCASGRARQDVTRRRRAPAGGRLTER